MYNRSTLSLVCLSALIIIALGRCASTGSVAKNPNSLEATNELISVLEARIVELEAHKQAIKEAKEIKEALALQNAQAEESNPLTGPVAFKELNDVAVTLSGPVIIRGQVNGNLKHIRIKKFQPYQADISKKVLLSESGSFITELEIEEPGYYKINAGNNAYDVFLKPGASVEFTLEVPTSEIIFSGDLATANNFCSISRGREESKYELNEADFTMSLVDFETNIKDLKTTYESSLVSYTTEGMDTDFMRLEQAIYNCGYNRALLQYHQKNELPATACNFENPIIDAPELFGVYEYRKWAFEYFEAVSAQLDFNKVTSKVARLDYFKEKYEGIDIVFKSKVLKDFMKTDVVYTCVARVCSPIMNEMVSEFFNEIENKPFKNKIEKRYASIMKGKKGALAPRLTGRDRTGKNVSLDKYKGKYVYLFTWASWCGPCKMEVEPFHHLLQEFSGKNIEFVGVSIDKDKDKWLKSFTKRDAFPGNQIRIGGNWNSPFVQAYDIASVPQGVLIGPDGTVIDSNAPKPSKLRNTLLSYNI